MLQQLREMLPLLRGYGVHLGDLTAVLARRYEQRPAIVDAPLLGRRGSHTFEELEEAVAGLAGVHRDAGVGTDEVVVVRLSDPVATLVNLLALARLGATPLLADVRVVPDDVDRLAGAAGAQRRLTDGDLATLHGAGGRRAVAEADRDPDVPTLLVATPGTTGRPKAAALSSHGLLSAIGRLAIAPVGWRTGIRADRDLVLSALAVTQVNGLSVALSALCAGIPLLARTDTEPAALLDALERHGPNVVAAMPATYADLELAGAADRDLRSVQLWLSTGDLMPATRARRFQRAGAAGQIGDRGVGTAAFVDVYGTAELSGPAALRVNPPSLIRPVPSPPLRVTLPGVEVRAVDTDGASVGWGAVGRLQFRGPGALHHRLPAEHTDASGGRSGTGEGSGWVATGDLGKVWPGDTFSLVGREVDRLEVDGVAVDPALVESQVRERRGVLDALLVGVRESDGGDRPVLLVVPRPGWDRDELVRWAGRALRPAQRPRAVVEVDRIPSGPHGRVDRAAGRALAERALGPARDPTG